MVRKPSTFATADEPKLVLSARQISLCISRIEDRIAELKDFNVRSLEGRTSPGLQALEVAIQDTLERCFGLNTSAAKRYSGAASLHYTAYVVAIEGGRVQTTWPIRREKFKNP